MHADCSAELWKSATWVLDTGRAGRPLPACGSSWAVAVTAIGFAYTDPARAWQGLRDVVQSTADRDTPPLHAVAAWEVYRHSAAHGADLIRQAQAELAWLYPRLSARQDAPAGAAADPAFEAVSGAAHLALAQIAGALGRPGDADRHRDRAGAVTAALVRRLWDPATGTFRARDARGGFGPAHTSGGLLPLLLPDLPAEHAEAILAEARSERFGLPGRTGLPVPGNDGSGPGPIRVDLNWLLRRGMLVHGHRPEAEQLRIATIGLVHANGHYAGYHPQTGEGIGGAGDIRTAALCLDLLADRSAPVYARA